MPQTILGRKYSTKPKTNIFAAVYRQKMKEQGLNAVELGKALGVTDRTIQAQLKKPMESWKLKDIKDYCKAVDWSFSEAMQTVLMSI